MQRFATAVVIASSMFTLGQSVDKELRGLFDDTTPPIATADALPSWAQTLNRITEQEDELSLCISDESSCVGRLKSVHHLIVRGSDLTLEQRVRLVNRYVNRFSRYRSDRRRDVPVGDTTVRIGQEWSTLTEFLQRGGDCEDYATAKYQLFRLFGIPAEDLRVIVIYDRIEREHHAIIGIANVDGDAVLLDTDNQTYRRRPNMYQFVYALNEDYVWDYGVETTRLKWSVRRALREKKSQ